MTSIVLGIFGILVVVFLFGGCSLKYFDPQYYECGSLAKKESGIYIVNEIMYEILTKKQGNTTFVVDRKTDSVESTDYGRIKSAIDLKYCFLDETNQKTMICDDKHLVYYHKIFVYRNPGFWITGDEGSGFRIRWYYPLICSNEQKFIFKDHKWQRI